MFRRFLHISLLLAAFGLPAAATAEIYRWVDSQGREHFTTDLDQVPRSQRAAVKNAADSRPTVNRADSQPVAAPRRAANPRRARPRSTAAPPGSERIDGWSEDQWRERAGELGTEVEILEKRVEELEDQGADNLPASARRSNLTYRTYSRYRERYRLWEKTNGDLQRAQARLERFEDRARRAGVPPGWLR